MSFDKESKSEDFVCGWGGGEAGRRGGGSVRLGVGGGFRPKKKRKRKKEICIMYSLIFCAHALYKISSS